MSREREKERRANCMNFSNEKNRVDRATGVNSGICKFSRGRGYGPLSSLTLLINPSLTDRRIFLFDSRRLLFLSLSPELVLPRARLP